MSTFLICLTIIICFICITYMWSNYQNNKTERRIEQLQTEAEHPQNNCKHNMIERKTVDCISNDAFHPSERIVLYSCEKCGKFEKVYF